MCIRRNKRKTVRSAIIIVGRYLCAYGYSVSDKYDNAMAKNWSQRESESETRTKTLKYTTRLCSSSRGCWAPESGGDARVPNPARVRRGPSSLLNPSRTQHKGTTARLPRMGGWSTPTAEKDDHDEIDLFCHEDDDHRRRVKRPVRNRTVKWNRYATADKDENMWRTRTHGDCMMAVDRRTE